MKKYKKIVFYGDSITKGTYTEESCDYPDYAELLPQAAEMISEQIGKEQDNA